MTLESPNQASPHSLRSRGWSKSIPARRDRLQARLLVCIVGAMLALLCLQALTFGLVQGRLVRVLFVEDLAISCVFALAVWTLRAATGPAALAGGAVCLLVSFYTGSPRLGPLHSGLTPLMELFVLTFAATRAGRRRKERAGVAESRRGRSAAQVLANLGAAGLLASACGAFLVQAASSLTGRFLFVPAVLPVLVLAALAEATADTVSSEVGQAFGGAPILITTLRRVPAGTDGAMSLTGTAAGVVAAALVACVAAWALRLSLRDAAIGLLGGVAGLLFDSLLGATVERRGWFGNDLVNFASTLSAVIAALVLLVAVRSTLP